MKLMRARLTSATLAFLVPCLAQAHANSTAVAETPATPTPAISLRIDDSCAKYIGGERRARFEVFVNEGLRCLQGLRGEGARENATKLAALLSYPKAPVKIGCRSGAKWAEMAHATSDKDDPDYPALVLTPKVDKITERETKGLLLHELLHLLGHRHDGQGIEYPYTCEHCCFPGEEAASHIRDIACRVCGGAYPNIRDRRYLRDIVDFQIGIDRPTVASRLVRQHLLKNPRDLYARELLAKTFGDEYMGVVAVALLDGHRKRYGELSDEGKKLRSEILKKQDPALIAKFGGFAASLAEAQWLLLEGRYEDIEKIFRQLKLNYEARFGEKQVPPNGEATRVFMSRYSNELLLDVVEHYQELQKKAPNRAEFDRLQAKVIPFGRLFLPEERTGAP